MISGRVFVIFKLVVVLTCSVISNVRGMQENNTYIILAPKTFRPGMSMAVQVTILKSPSPVEVNASILNEVTKEEVATANGTYEEGIPGNLDVKVPFGKAVKGKTYALLVTGKGGLNFKEKAYVQFEEKGFSIYIQTDKGVYKPGQTVHMRILAVFPNLKPYLGNMNVSILDPNGNKMQNWKDLKGPAGVVEKDFALSSDPVYGNWKISVIAEKQTQEQTIEIKEYVLPRFKVTVELPPFVVEGTQEVKGKVISKYTYGKGVKGVAIVRAFFSVWNPKKQAEITKSVNIVDGIGSFSFAINDINKIFKSSWSGYNSIFEASWVKLTINATVEEILTGKTASEENQVSFFKTDVKLSFPKMNPDTFKPGLKYIAMLAVTKPDDTPLPPERLQNIKVFVKTNFEKSSKGTIEEYIPSSEGFITLLKDIPEKADTLFFQASQDESFKKSDFVDFSANKAVSPSSSFIQLSTASSSYKARDEVDCKVRTTFPLTFVKITYVVLSRGNILLSKVKTLVSSGKEASFKFQTTHSMSPSARLVAYIIQKNGEVVVDSMNLKIEKPFENTVSVAYSRKESRPGDHVVVTAKATPGSYLGFLAVDESVLLMKKDNDLSHSKVIQELETYDSAHSFPWLHWEFGRRRRRRMIMLYPTSGRDAASVFENSGIIVLSNCNVYRRHGGYIHRHKVAFASGDAEASSADRTMLFSLSAGQAPKLKEVTRVRQLFPETWIWRNATADTSGEADFLVPAPDTITTWVASAFALHSTTGFGVVPMKPKLKVFQPFFVSVDLPYSVIRGEQVAIKVLVFNYLDEAMEVKITLKKSSQWLVINELTKNDSQSKESREVVHMVTVPAGEGTAVSFPIIPIALDYVPVVVQAQSTQAADAVSRELLVEAEGMPQEYSYSLLIDLNSTNVMRRQLELKLPLNTVPGSAKAKVTVIGDILGSTISNLDNLLRMPYGCGEQNMINFAPNIFVMKYLETVRQLSPKIKEKAERYMNAGYQREQKYRHKEGSYSAFGERDSIGSLWLTAFVAKSFTQARDYIYIDHDSLHLSLDWIVRQQKADGSFPRVGTVHSSALKGGLKGEMALTAYVLITLVEAKSIYKKADAVNQATSYIEKKIQDILKEEDPYTLAITYYALTLAQSSSRFSVKQKLLTLAQRQDGTVHWAEKKVAENRPTWWSPYYRPPSADIEITAYVLLALAIEKDMKLGLEVVRWLSQQRNSLGGYGSTQDTVVGIQALAEFASQVYSSDVSISMSIRGEELDKSVTIEKSNMMVLQVIDLPKVEGSLKIDASGHGYAMLQVGVSYNVNSTSETPAFDFRLEIVRDERYRLETKACAKWTGDSDASDMAVMEVGILSGFALDTEEAQKLMDDKSLSLKRVDTSGRKVMLYFDEIRKATETCLKLRFERSHAVGKAQPVPAVLYDYYHPEKRSSALYMSKMQAVDGVCSVCPTCVNCADQIGPSARPGSRGSHFHNCWLRKALLVILAIAITCVSVF